MEDISRDVYEYVTDNKLTPTEALLYLIFSILKEMKTQEREYWEIWRKKNNVQS